MISFFLTKNCLRPKGLDIAEGLSRRRTGGDVSPGRLIISDCTTQTAHLRGLWLLLLFIYGSERPRLPKNQKTHLSHLYMYVGHLHVLCTWAEPCMYIRSSRPTAVQQIPLESAIVHRTDWIDSSGTFPGHLRFGRGRLRPILSKAVVGNVDFSPSSLRVCVFVPSCYNFESNCSRGVSSETLKPRPTRAWTGCRSPHLSHS